MGLMVTINGFPLALIYPPNSIGSPSAQRKYPRSRCSNILLRPPPIELYSLQWSFGRDSLFPVCEEVVEQRFGHTLPWSTGPD